MAARHLKDTDRKNSDDLKVFKKYIWNILCNKIKKIKFIIKYFLIFMHPSWYNAIQLILGITSIIKKLSFK